MHPKHRFSFLIVLYLLTSQSLSAGCCIQVLFLGRPVAGALVLIDDKQVVSDSMGMACFQLETARYQVSVSHMNFLRWQGLWNGTDSLRVELEEVETTLSDVNIYSLEGESLELRSPQSVQKVNNYLIANTNVFNFTQFLDKLPATTVSDGQINLRGSGFMLNAASRVMVLVDGTPFLTTDYNDVRWATIPTELVEYATVLKGASSVMYGSNSLYGVLDIRTLWPDTVASTQLVGFYQTYGRPPGGRAWWTADNAPFQQGFSFRHLNPITKKLQLALGINHLRNQSFLKTVYNEHTRLSVKLRYNFSSRSNLGMDFHGGKLYDAEFLIWNNTGEGLFKPYARADSLGAISIPNFIRDQFNAHLYYNFKTSQFQHTLRMRLLDLKTLNFKFNVNTSVLGAEYHVQTSLGGIKIKGGTLLQHFFYRRQRTVLEASSFAGYALAQWQKNRFNFNLGTRFEAYRSEAFSGGFPIFSAGVNYWLGKWILRSNFGQGFRIPSFGERLISLQNASLPIYANPDLKPENGYTFELGIKRTLDWGNWQGYLDAALFMNYFDNYIELIPGVYSDSLTPPYTLEQIEKNFGFKYFNINKVRNGGIDFTFQGLGKVGLCQIRILGGYLYSYSVDAERLAPLSFAGSIFESMWKGGRFITDPVLFGRQRGLSKLDVEFGRKRWTLGLDIRHYGAIEKLQEIYEVMIPGLQRYRRQDALGKLVFGLRLGYDAGKLGRLMLIGSNLTNRIYSIRPARAEAPINLTLQYKLDF